MTAEHLNIVRQAQLVRDYLIVAGTGKALPLIEALEPLENSSDPETQDLARLRAVSNEIFSKLDQQTLDSIFSGQFSFDENGVHYRTSFLLRIPNIVTVIGLLLMALSLYYTNWSTRAGSTITIIESAISETRSLNIREIIEANNFCDRRERVVKGDEFYDFIENIETVEYIDARLIKSISDSSLLITGFVPFSKVYWDVRNLFRDPKNAASDQEQAAGKVSGAPDPTQQLVSGGSVAKREDQSPADFCETLNKMPGTKGEFEWFRASANDLTRELNLVGGSLFLSGHKRSSLEFAKQRLEERQRLVARWILPVTHGALGAVIFCLVSALRSPFNAPISHRQVFLRIFFGAFVGYLITALFVPAGILGASSSNSAPVASLAAFVFGYSIDSFLALLNRLNEFISSPSASKDAGDK